MSNNTQRPDDTPAMPARPGSMQDNMAVMPVGSGVEPAAPSATPDPSGSTTDAAYGNEQAQRQKNAEEGKAAEWVSTDPVD